MTVWCLPLIEPDVRISRIRLSEAVHRVASWLAGKAFAAISELPLPSGTVGVSIPCGPSPGSLSAWNASAQLPRLRSVPFSGISSLLCRAPTPAHAIAAFPIFGVVPHVEALASRAQVSRVIAVALSDMPSPPTPPER